MAAAAATMPKAQIVPSKEHMCGTRILAVCGSLRTGSYNQKILNIACDYLKKKEHVTVEFFSFKENELPFYDQDIEQSKGLSFGNIGLFREKVNQAHGVLIAGPEYNSSVSAVLKNAIDWSSRAPNCWSNKFVGIMGAAMGSYGTIRYQTHIRSVLTLLNAKVLNQSVALPAVHTMFDEKGQFKDPANQQRIEQLCDALVQEIRDVKLIEYGKLNLKKIDSFAFIE